MEQDFDKEYLELLAHKYKAGTLSDQEAAYFESWYNSFKDDRLELPVSFGPNPVAVRERIHQKLRDRIAASKQNHRRHRLLSLTWQWSVAAAVVLVVSGILVFNYSRPSKNVKSDVTADTVNIRPGSDKAFLKLSNGTTVQLASLPTGMITDEAQAGIEKIASGQIVYNTNDGPSNAQALAFNTLITPNGGQFRVTLPDGTKVWLNAASSLKYPVDFPDNGNRKVELTGEAYFEVAKDKARPFIVASKGQEVEVLGTHFNINSYEDEGTTRTILEEGSVKVSSAEAEKVMLPGQQATVAQQGSIMISKADLETALAWKNGQMEFRDADLHTIMRQVARWYDIDIKFRGDTGNRRFNGSVSRSSNLSALLRILEFSDIHFELSGGKRKTLTVIP